MPIDLTVLPIATTLTKSSLRLGTNIRSKLKDTWCVRQTAVYHQFQLSNDVSEFVDSNLKKFVAAISSTIQNTYTRYLPSVFLLNHVSEFPTGGDGAVTTSIKTGAPTGSSDFFRYFLPIVVSGLGIGLIVTLMAQKYGMSRVSGLRMAACAYVGITISEDAGATPVVFWT